MAPAGRGLLDTSVFIALESGRHIDLERLPEESVICPVTIAELHAGVLVAADVESRARRLATLEATADIDVLPIDAEVAAGWARRARGPARLTSSASPPRRCRHPGTTVIEHRRPGLRLIRASAVTNVHPRDSASAT